VSGGESSKNAVRGFANSEFRDRTTFVLKEQVERKGGGETRGERRTEGIHTPTKLEENLGDAGDGGAFEHVLLERDVVRISTNI